MKKVLLVGYTIIKKLGQPTCLAKNTGSWYFKRSVTSIEKLRPWR